MTINRDLAAQVSAHAAFLAATDPDRLLCALGVSGYDVADAALTALLDALRQVTHPLARDEYRVETGTTYPDSADEEGYVVHAAQPLILPRSTVEAWVGKPLVGDEITRLANAVPFSSVPEALAAIAEQFDAPTPRA